MSEATGHPSPSKRTRELTARVLPALVWALLIFIGGGSHTQAPELDLGIPTDKLEHALAFLIMQLLAFRALRYFRAQGGRPKLAWSAAGISVAVGVALELYQLGLPHRSAEVADAVADAVGAGLGAIALSIRG